VDDAVGAVAVHGVAGFLGMLWVGVFAAGYPTGINNVDSSIGGQLMGMATFLPLGFLSGWVASLILKKLNLLRVPAAVELEGLDLVEYGTLVYPEMGVVKEQIIQPDGTLVATSTVTQLGDGRPPEYERMGP
jgi:Amt family ammonium transporter